MPERQEINPRWLPTWLSDKGYDWFAVDDPTALAIGDYVFNPSAEAFYAGKVTGIGPNFAIIHWYKGYRNEFATQESHATLTTYWWNDPVLQGVNA